RARPRLPQEQSPTGPPPSPPAAPAVPTRRDSERPCAPEIGDAAVGVDMVEGRVGSGRVGGFGLLEGALNGRLDPFAHLGLGGVVQQIVSAQIAPKDVDRVAVAGFFTLAFG